MKKLFSAFLILSLLTGLLGGCVNGKTANDGFLNGTTQEETTSAPGFDNVTFGESPDESDAYCGYFEEDTVDVTVTCLSGTAACYTLDGNTLTFTELKEDSVYSVSGRLKGNIIIDVGNDHKFDLELRGFSLVSQTVNPITVFSGNKVSVTAKNETENYIYDVREAVDKTDETQFTGAIYSAVDLEICGKGSLTVVSEYNNGIHGKKDLQVKNLSLLVICSDNALKGNDSVEIKDCSSTLIAVCGDGIKTTDSDVSEKGNQRGTVSISGGTHNIYAACDGIDASYNVVIDGDATEINIYTDKYSTYSEEVTAVDADIYYIRFTDNSYKYSVKYYNSDDDLTWVNAEYHSTASGNGINYYYYSFPKLNEYDKMQFFIYSSDMEQGQDEESLVCSDYLTPNTEYDTFALTNKGGRISYQWTDYTTTVRDNGFGGFGGMGGHGGMNDGNTDKGDHSTKGIKACNGITVNGGTVNIKSYDDAIHAGDDVRLENGSDPTGSITVNGGTITVYSNDDGLHADGTLNISSGAVCVTGSYEGLEGSRVVISGGNVSIASSDDGINGVATSDTTVEISGGTVYINCTGDGIDSNSRTSYKGIVFSGGSTVIIANSNNNSAIDTEQGYEYSGGSVIAIMPSRGMTGEAVRCSNFSSVGSSKSLSLTGGEYLTVSVGNKAVASVKMTADISATVIYLGDSSASFSTEASSSASFDQNGVCRY